MPWLIAIGGLLLFASVIARRRPNQWRCALMLGMVSLSGAASHHMAWSGRGPVNITRFVRDEPVLVRLVGRVISHPEIQRRRDAGRKAAWPVEDRTRLTVTCEALSGSEAPLIQRVTGCVQLSIAGHVIDLAVGDQIEITGWLQNPGRARNPGGFDTATFLRIHGIDAMVHADHPEAVHLIAADHVDLLGTLRSWREEIVFRFAQHLSDENAAIGAAMIVGDRSAIPIEMRDAYVASGAMHVLAISGLHIGILATFLMFGLRILHVPASTASVVVVALIWFYAAVTDFGPPVVRAGVFCTIWALASLQQRRSSLLNVASATGVLLLLWDPLLLFDIGARLSFLAILGMAWTLRMFPVATRLSVLPDESLSILRFARPFFGAQVLGLGIWLFTAPIVAAEFGIVSPAGFLLNVVLIPFATLVLWSGYVFFGTCLVAPQLAAIPAGVFDAGLSGVNWLVSATASWNMGHIMTPSPPGWWLTGFYTLLLMGLARPCWSGTRLRGLSLLSAWCLGGLVSSAWLTGPDRPPLEVIILDVGHGGAMLIDPADGPCLLFDCGSMQNNRGVADSVWRTLRARGRTSLDAVVVSHADLDHCNNVPALMNGGPVGSLLVSRSFLNFDQQVVADTVNAARTANVPIRLVAAGDRLRLDPRINARILHPPDRPPGDDDNANSIVLEIEFAGRTLLLTGDLEGSGQEEVMATVPDPTYDVLAAPHHGGLKANTPRFAAWASPSVVVVSCGERVNAAALDRIYPEADLFLTSQHGALTLSFDADGTVRIVGAAHDAVPSSGR